MSLFKDCKFIGKKHHIWCSVWSEQLLALGIIVCNCYLYYYYAVYNMVYISYWKYHCNTLKAQMPEDALALPMLFILYCMVCTISIPPFWGYSTIWTSKRRLKIWVKIPALAFFVLFTTFLPIAYQPSYMEPQPEIWESVHKPVPFSECTLPSAASYQTPAHAR